MSQVRALYREGLRSGRPWVWPEACRLTASSNGVHQASEGRDVVSVRIEVHAIFLFRDFPNLFP
jgi:hypothetical protein